MYVFYDPPISWGFGGRLKWQALWNIVSSIGRLSSFRLSFHRGAKATNCRSKIVTVAPYSKKLATLIVVDQGDAHLWIGRKGVTGSQGNRSKPHEERSGVFEQGIW